MIEKLLFKFWDSLLQKASLDIWIQEIHIVFGSVAIEQRNNTSILIHYGTSSMINYWSDCKQFLFVDKWMNETWLK